MDHFIVRDIEGLLQGWDLRDYCVNGKPVTEPSTAIMDLEKHRPVIIYQDGAVYRTDRDHDVDILIEHTSYTDEEFMEMWREFGYPDSSIDE